MKSYIVPTIRVITIMPDTILATSGGGMQNGSSVNDEVVSSDGFFVKKQGNYSVWNDSWSE